MIAKSGSSPAASGWARSRRAQKPWKVPTNARLGVTRGLALAELEQPCPYALRSSPAARSVNVIARIRAGAMPSSRHRRDEALDQHGGLAAAGRRGQQQRPCPARDRVRLLVGQRVAMLAAADRRVHAAAAVAHVSGRGWSSPRRASAAAARAESRASREQLATPRARHVAADSAELHACVGVEHPARTQVAACQRLVEAADRARRSSCSTACMYRATWRSPSLIHLRAERRAPALVVVHHRFAVRADVDAVDPPAQPNAVPELQRRQLLLVRSRTQLQGARLQPAVALGGVPQVALEIRVQAPPRHRARARGAPTADRSASLAASALASSSRARPRAAGVEPGATASRGAAPRACPSAPRGQARRGRAARGRDPGARGRSIRSTNQLTGQPIQLLERGRRPHALSQPRQQALVAQPPRRAAPRTRERAGRRGGWGPSACADRLDGPQRAGVRAPASTPRSNRSHTSSTNSDRGVGCAIVVGHVPAQHQQLLRARDGRIEQVALGREHVFVLAEPQPGDLRQTPALLLAEQRLRARAGGEHPFLQAAQEQRPHPARAQRQRVEHGDRVAGSPLRSPPRNSRPRERIGEPAGARAGASSGARARARAAPPAPGARPPARPRLLELARLRARRAGAPGSAEQPVSSRAARSISAAGAASPVPPAAGRSSPAASCAAPTAPAPRPRRYSRAAHARAPASRPAPGARSSPGARSQASRSAARRRDRRRAPVGRRARHAAQQADQRPADRRVARTAGVARSANGTPAALKHLSEQLRRRSRRARTTTAISAGPMPRPRAAPGSRPRPAPARRAPRPLEQPHRAGPPARAAELGLEQRALEVARAARGSAARSGRRAAQRAVLGG